MEIFGHGDVTGVCSVVPVDGESAEEGTNPVEGDGVEFMEVLDEVVGVLFSNVLDAKVVYNKGEEYGFGVVLPQRRGSGYRGETELGEVSFESVDGDAVGLLEAGHAFSDLKVDLAVGTECAEAVLFNYFVWDAG